MNRNSALIWLPAIERAGLPTPRTIIVPYSHRACLSIFDGEPSAEFDRLCAAVMAAAGEIGFPVFVRTDLTSAKHSGPRAYRIDSADANPLAIGETLEDTELKTWLERDGAQAFLVREFLTLESPFTAFREFPVSREFRFFADADRVLCWHPYWPANAIEDHRPSREDWRELLADLQRTPKAPELWYMAVAAAKACGGGEWSVDMCRDVTGKWWITDMARAEDSFHWEDCPWHKT